jgi:hypothetical protein
MTRTHVAFCVLTAALLIGCEMPFGIGSGGGEDAPSPQLRDEVQVEPGLALRLYAPERVAPGDSFEVRFVAENTTGYSIEVQTGACWGQPAAFFAGEQVPLVGSRQVCTLQLLSWTLPGQKTRERTFDMKAALNVSSGSPEEEGLAEPGTYELKARLDWTVGGQKIDKTLEAPVEVAAGN